MPRYRIRYQGSDLEMPAGEFVVGRSSSCNLALDDALVSRRHASIFVLPDGVWIEDHGSRNGVAVNGERIEGRRKVAHLDRITIGSHDLMLVELPELTITCDACALVQPLDSAFCSRCGSLMSKASPTLAGMTLEIPSPLKAMDASATQRIELQPGRGMSTAPPAEEATGTGAALLTGIADKAIALGRFDEAERVLGRSLAEILSRARAGTPLAPSRIQEATRYALRLAEGTRRASWLEWIFDLHAATGRLMGADEIEKLHELVRKLRYSGVGGVRRYLEVIRHRAHELGPAERFLLQRLEGLERLVSA